MAFHVSWLRLILLIEVQKSYFVVGLRFWIYYLFAEKLFNVDEHVSNVQTPCSENQPKIKVLGFRWIWDVFGILRFSKRVICDESEFSSKRLRDRNPKWPGINVSRPQNKRFSSHDDIKVFREDIWITSLMDQNHLLSTHGNGSKCKHF